MHYIIDANIWIYLLEGRQELLTLKHDIENQAIIPVLTPVVLRKCWVGRKLMIKKNKMLDNILRL